MNVIVYESMKPNQERLSTLIESCGSIQTIKFFDSFKNLVSHLRQPSMTMEIYILHPTDLEDLERLIALRNMFVDAKVILILPDDEKEMVNQGHRLHPRYMCSAQGNWEILRSIIQNLAKAG